MFINKIIHSHLGYIAMINRWLSWLNFILIGLIACLLLATGIVWAKRPVEIACSNPISKQCRLPKSAFTLNEESYQRIGEPLLVLQNAPPTLQVPDLKPHLMYYGKNGRPDAQSTHTNLHFSFMGSKNVVSIGPNQKLYLVYDKKSLPCHYVFSPHNAETSLWIEATPNDNEAAVKVFMKNDKGEIITEPENHSHFKVSEKEFIRYSGATWEIGSWRVDGTLLARQKARWFGCDRFLERHGGEEYKAVIGKQRIDFGDGDDIYSVFVAVGDCLMWDGQQWKATVPGEASLKSPLLVVKKVDERLMTFELWDVEGKGKLILNILKSTEPWLMQNPTMIQQTFKFVGARTRTQCVFEINHERMLIRPSDWLLLTTKGWKKLTTEEEIDQYVKRKSTGNLFVFEGLARKDDRQIMKGTLYNPTRSDFQVIELSIQQGGGKSSAKDSKNNKEVEDDYDDDRLLESSTTSDSMTKSSVDQTHPPSNRPPHLPPAVPIPPKDQLLNSK